ncbi:hypothetical protein KV557_24795 [Kitasatospora aureofaciens]|uniref:hypothetical protein n=1 Tax=Kitasatospora aureofaciens TaxID=1894 RepID=UPI001C43E12C|nr:hypothetical protein [Kitasatospora aureofaciens]MBV6700284.1 hypothetical protein [Kitasatospora aureofaciens]
MHTPLANGGSRAVAAIEALWAEIRRHHPDVPTVVVTTGPARSAKLAQHTPRRYGTAGELFVSAQAFADGAALLVAVLHEAAHALNHARGTRDTSSTGGRYHSARFAEAAHELGFEVPRRPATGTGYAAISLPESTTARYAFALALLDFAATPEISGLDGWGDGGESPEGLFGDEQVERVVTPARAGKRLKVGCRCTPPRTMWVTPGMWELGGIMCQVCGGDFAPIE